MKLAFQVLQKLISLLFHSWFLDVGHLDALLDYKLASFKIEIDRCALCNNELSSSHCVHFLHYLCHLPSSLRVGELLQFHTSTNHLLLTIFSLSLTSVAA